MASRLLFEDDIAKTSLNQATDQSLYSDLKIKQESDKGSSGQDGIVPGNKEPCISNNHLNSQETKTPYNMLKDNHDISHDDDNIISITAKGNEVGGNTVNEDTVRSSVHIIGTKKKVDDTIDPNSEHEGNRGHHKEHNRNLDETFEVMIKDTNENTIHTRDQQAGNNSKNSDTDLGKSAQNPTQNEQTKGNKTKGKKRTELERLGIDIKEGADAIENPFDVFGDESKIYRKYKFRKTEQTIKYTEPIDLKPEDWGLIEWKKTKRRDSSDDEKGAISCTLCKRNFETKKALHLHIRSHKSSVLEYKCALCSQKFDKNSDLIAHKSTHASESFLCEKCKVAFSDHCDYLQHNLIHAKKSSHFTCPECGLRYAKWSYKGHILTHFDKKLTCPICPFTVNGEFNLQSHINTHKHQFDCVECGKVLKSKKHFEYHMSSHTGVKKYQCLYCGKCFVTHGAREIHTRIHTGERPFACDICGHTAKQHGDIKRHKVTHETEKKFACDICGKKFFHKEYLVGHKRKHTKTSLYDCPECERTFTHPGGLKVHIMYKHSNERPVECKYCSVKFINENQLQKHSRSLYHQRNKYAFETNQDTRVVWKNGRGLKIV